MHIVFFGEERASHLHAHCILGLRIELVIFMHVITFLWYFVLCFLSRLVSRLILIASVPVPSILTSPPCSPYQCSLKEVGSKTLFLLTLREITTISHFSYGTPVRHANC